MKFTKTKTEEIEVEITFPHYRKSLCHTYKVINEKEAILVTLLDGWHSIGFTVANNAFNGTEECSEEYFTHKFNKVLKLINV